MASYFLGPGRRADVSSRLTGMLRWGSSLSFLGPFTVRMPSEEREEVMVRGSTSAGILYFLLNSRAMEPCWSFGGGGKAEKAVQAQ